MRRPLVIVAAVAVAWLAGVGGPGAGGQTVFKNPTAAPGARAVWSEQPAKTGALTFTLARVPNPPGSLRLYVNGLRQAARVGMASSYDFVLAGNTITFHASYATPSDYLDDATVLCDYQY